MVVTHKDHHHHHMAPRTYHPLAKLAFAAAALLTLLTLTMHDRHTSGGNRPNRVPAPPHAFDFSVSQQ